MDCTFIANSGIQMATLRLSLDPQNKFKMWFHEWYDTSCGQWKLELVHEVVTDDAIVLYNKQRLFDEGYLTDSTLELDPSELRSAGITPLKVEDQICEGVKGELFKLTFSDKHNKLEAFENKWLPAPYFFRRTEKRFKFGPVNWSRFKLVPRKNTKGVKEYDVLLAFDTRAGYVNNEYNEYPVFPDKFSKEMTFDLCDNEFFLMDFCSSGNNWSYIDEYIFNLVHPNLRNVAQIHGSNIHRMSYIASYMFLVNYIAQNKLFPRVKLFKDSDVESKDVDMIVDIGNSRTTALLIEDNKFTKSTPLRLTDYTETLVSDDDGCSVRTYSEPFDMRLVFRKVGFGSFGIRDSKQFIYPSFVRLGNEANTLVHLAANDEPDSEGLTTYSSPKRYLWDSKPSKQEWQFLVLPGEEDNHILYLKGGSNLLKSDGHLDPTGTEGGRSSHYSRKSLMTFAFLEMLTQANIQVNSDRYRTDNGCITMPRKIRRVIVTCPTAMSKIEREALVKCARDAVYILYNFAFGNINPTVDIIPAAKSMKDSDGTWYYDEATCAQLVYMYGEVGYKYRGCCGEFFNLYGKKTGGSTQPTLTVGSLDIGAGTTDLMISEYSYTKGDIVTLTPDPKFYDSFYFAGDDMLYALIRNIMLLDEKHSAFRKKLRELDVMAFRQKMKNYFGPDYAGQTMAARKARRDFNIQYSIPLMYYFLNLASNNSSSCSVSYDDVFNTCPPNEHVINDFKERVGIDITTLSWEYDKAFVSDIITKEFEPLFKKLATIFFAYGCDVILLSGRPASLPAIRDLFLKYYAVSPNRLITLNNYYVGDWYPFDENTGFIKNPKTIVAMGGVIGYYASEFSKLDKFSLNLEKLRTNLKSTVNYIEASRDGNSIDYMITPDKNQGEITISKLPSSLKVRQFGLASYPSRDLYSIDFNWIKLASKVKTKANANGESLSDAAVQARLKNEVDALQMRMPFTISIEKDIEDKEKLTITSILDRNGAEVSDSCIEIHIQSLGDDEETYWLDSGAFNF